jgi:hypothetical protein
MAAFGGRSSIRVIDSPRRITAPHGISAPERDLLAEGLDYMRRYGPGAFVSIEAGRTPETEREVRRMSRKAKSHIATYQDRAGMWRVLWTEVQEALDQLGFPKFGAHIVASMPDADNRDRLVQSFNGSESFRRNVYAEPVTDWEGLKDYLLKEATPQAAFRKGFRRIKGSHPLGELGGDRVRLSPDLKHILERAGRTQPYTRTYAARRPKAVGTPRAWLFNADGQGVLFDVAETPAPAKSPAMPIQRTKLAPLPTPMLRLFSALPNVDVIDAMKTLGPTHQSIAERLSISRAQVTNILNRQFGPSSGVVQRVLELTKAA